MNNCNNVEVQDMVDVDIDSFDTVPDYFLIERDIYDPATGNTEAKLLRAPGSKVLPNGNYDNIIVQEMNTTAIEVPENQVRAGYIYNGGSSYIMRYADSSHNPNFLMLGLLSGNMMIQNTGFVNIPEGHSYIVGTRYYVGANGVPTTSSASGYSLFVPISSTKLAIDMRRVSVTGLDGITANTNAQVTAAANTETEILLSSTGYTAVGNGLTMSDNRVYVSGDISAVEVSASVNMSGSTSASARIEIVRNIGGNTANRSVISSTPVTVGTTAQTYTLVAKVANVAQNDTISLYVYPASTTLTVNQTSFLTVKQLA